MALAKALQLHGSAQFYILNVFLQVMSSELYLLRWLDLTGCKCLNNELVNAVFENNPNLETVDLSECQHLTSACLQKLAVSAKKLKRYNRNILETLNSGPLNSGKPIINRQARLD